MKLLPKEHIEIELCEDGKSIVAALYKNHGWLDWKIYQLSDLPNELISLDDLERFGINKE